MWCVVGGGPRKSWDKLDDGWWMVDGGARLHKQKLKSAKLRRSADGSCWGSFREQKGGNVEIVWREG